MLVEGCIVMLDIDCMGELVERLGLPEYKPNMATGFLSAAVAELASKHRGVVIYGLDVERGTEEAVLEFPFKSCQEISGDLERIRAELYGMGFSLSAVCLDGLVVGKETPKREEAFRGTPWRRVAYRELMRAKRRHKRPGGREGLGCLEGKR